MPTVSEQRMWNWLRNRTFEGHKFRRQVAVGRYVLDFYCPGLRLAIEMDGRQHETPWMSDYDGHRAAFLNTRGIEVVRISNETLVRYPLIVEEMIGHAIRERTAPHPPGT